MTDKLQNRATEIIRPLVPPDAEERVNRSFKQWNQIVRDHIRTETGLKLSDGDSRYTIPVRVVEGFPVKLAQLIDQYRDPVMWRLVIGQPKLGGLIHGLEFLLQSWEQVEQWTSLPEPARNGQPILDRALNIAKSLQQVALTDKVVKQIKEIHEDILGVYRFAPSHRSSVELYWLPIAMVAAMIDVAIEDLTVVVLIHELAHGYTHIGRDIDGAIWGDSSFHDSDLRVIEGLAQFYTEVISARLATRTPSLFVAYQELLKLQSGPYLAHREWMEGDKRQICETVRFTLIAARSQRKVDYDYWQGLMADTSMNLSRGKGRRETLTLFENREELEDNSGDEDEGISETFDDELADQMTLIEAVRLLESAGVECVWDNSGLTALYSVDLKELAVTDSAYKLFEHIPTLISLEARNTDISDRSLVFISHLDSLEWLCLRRTAVTDEGLEHLRGLTSLRHLDLVGTAVAGPGLVHLKGLANLRELLVNGFQHHDQWLDMLRRELPQCEISLI